MAAELRAVCALLLAAQVATPPVTPPASPPAATPPAPPPASRPPVKLIAAPPMVSPDVLEPSVLNEVEHALDMVPTNAVSFAEMPERLRLYCTTNDVFRTNGLSRTDAAIRLVSAQGADGRWLVGTNDVTAAAVELLKGL